MSEDIEVERRGRRESYVAVVVFRGSPTPVWEAAKVDKIFGGGGEWFTRRAA